MMYQSYSSFLIQRGTDDLLRDIQKNNYRLPYNFSSNDYLNLSKHPKVINESIEYGKKYGVGATSVRILLKENQEIFSDLEIKIANSKKAEASMLFSSAYQLNATVIPAILDKNILKQNPIVYSDKLNHESIYHGIIFSGNLLIRYNHLDMNHLENLLKKNQNCNQPQFVFSETLYSMDGDVLDMDAIIYLKRKYGFFLYLDESHATGVLGSSGYGFSQDYSDDVDISISTLSKGIGAFGGFLVCRSVLKRYLINSSSGFIYSSVLPPPVIGAIDAAWDLVSSLEVTRQQIKVNSEILRKSIKQLGFDTGTSSSHIIPIILKNVEYSMQMSESLQKKGISVSLIRPPTVRYNTSRLRVCVNSSHSQEDIVFFIKSLEEIKDHD